MATQSTDDKQNPNPGIELPKSTNESQPAAGTEATKPISSPSVFVNSEPIREDQVQNAVKFLSHPKVRGSPVIYRRSFLEKKGLTKEEIDEAFRRVPDPSPSTQATPVTQDTQVQSKPSNLEAQAPAQALQPSGAAPTTMVSSKPTRAPFRYTWTHAVFAIGLMALSGAGTALLVKNSLIPRLKSWIRKVISEEDDVEQKSNKKPNLAEEAAAAAKAASVAASEVAKASQEMLSLKIDEKKYFGELASLLDVQLREMKSMSSALRRLEGQPSNPEGRRESYTSSKQPYANGRAGSDSRSVRSVSPPPSAEPSAAPHPKSYMEIMAMVQRGERPPNVRDIDDSPPDPNQPISNPRLAPKAKPWEVGQTQNSTSMGYDYPMKPEGWNHSAQENGNGDQQSSDNSVPWWQRKNVRITELDNEDGSKHGAYGSGTSAPPVHRTWVPPQPPPIAMAGVAEAIRRPKPSIPKEQVGDDQSVASSSDATDELQRVTKIAESGGATNFDGMNSEIKSTEIQEVQQDAY